MKKKILSVLLAFTMIFSLVSCGSKTTEKEENPEVDTLVESSTEANEATEDAIGESTEPDATTDDTTPKDKANISFTWWGNERRTWLTVAVLDKYTRQYPSVTFDPASYEWSDYWNQLYTMSETDELPDMLQMDYSYLEQYVNDGLLTDLTPYVESGLLDVSNVDPGILETGSIDGKLYAICAGVNAPALLYNRSLLDELGIAINDNMTLDEFVDISRQVYEKTGIKTALPYAASDNYLFFLMRAHGITEPFNEDSLNLSDAKVFLPGFRLYETGTEEGWIIGTEVYAELNVNVVEQSPLVLYTTPDTQSWCGFYWSNQMGNMIDAAPEGVEIGITTWPSDNPQKSNYLKPGQFFCVSSDAGENEKAAVEVVNYLLNSVAANEVLLGERGVPASSKVAANISPFLDNTGKTVTAYINNIVTPNCSPINPPIPDGAMQVYDYCNQLIDRILFGQISAEEAAVALYERGNEIMAQ